MRKGFTLVELSIVLVIIGLLIGGILVAQSMISTAKVATTVSQLQQFDAGVENFKTKYGYLPGDAPAFGGDGDGSLEMTATCGSDNDATEFACEIANFWSDLFPDQFTSSAFTIDGTQVVTTGPSKNAPTSHLGKAGSYFIAAGLTTDKHYVDTLNRRNFYLILDSSQAQIPINSQYYEFSATSSLNSAVKPSELLAIDTKIDDGIANSGNVLSGSIGDVGGGTGGPWTIPLATCSSGATYEVQNNSYECTPLIRIGAQTGDPQ